MYKMTAKDLEEISSLETSKRIDQIIVALCKVLGCSRLELFEYSMGNAASKTSIFIDQKYRIEMFRRACTLLDENHDELVRDFDQFMYFINDNKWIVAVAAAEIQLSYEERYNLL